MPPTLEILRFWMLTVYIVVQAATNLVNPVWISVSTNTLSAGGTSSFSDPQYQNYAAATTVSDLHERLFAPGINHPRRIQFNISSAQKSKSCLIGNDLSTSSRVGQNIRTPFSASRRPCLYHLPLTQLAAVTATVNVARNLRDGFNRIKCRSTHFNITPTPRESPSHCMARCAAVHL